MVDWKSFKHGTPLQIWQYRAACYVMDDEKALKIGEMCLEAERRGENCSVWHQSSVFSGSLDRCQCAECQRGALRGGR